MLASLLLNLRGRGTATFESGAPLFFRPHAPEITVEYESEQWAGPQGRAPTHSLEIVLDKAAVVSFGTTRRRPRQARTVEVEGVWAAEQGFSTGAKSEVRNWPFRVDSGQEVQVSGTKTRVKPRVALVDGVWAVVADIEGTKLAAKVSPPIISAGASALVFSEGLSAEPHPPRVDGIRNPSPAEIVAMVRASRRSRLL